jgi:hypothetical protein
MELQRLLLEVEVWPSGPQVRYYSKHSWLLLINAAKVVQESEPKSVEQTLEDYQSHTATNGLDQIKEDSKLFLLMRVVFDLPEDVSVDTNGFVPVFGGWVTMNEQFGTNGSVNVAWPIRWNNGHPILISGYYGIQGINSTYNARKEYMYFMSKYRMRHLRDR